MSSPAVLSKPGAMRALNHFDQKVEDMKPSKSDINWVIMDYLVTEGYPGAALKFAQETNICHPTDIESIQERVQIRNAIQGGRISDAVDLINEIDPEILDTDHLLHFHLLQLQLIEIIRSILEKPGGQPQSHDFLPAIRFATEQLSPRAPTDPVYQRALERTMALMIFPADKMPADFKDLLDVRLRETVATDVNRSILARRGERSEARIRQLVRARAWAEGQARDAKLDSIPAQIPIELDLGHEAKATAMDGDAMVT